MANDFEEALAPNLYFDRNFKIDAAKILPGEYYVTSRDMVLVTTLGSCVSACLRDSESGIGGMNHFMLPESNADAKNPLNTSARYGSYAMEILLNQLIKLGARRQNLEAKVFGGGSVLKSMTKTNVGKKNSEFVLSYLDTEGIKLVAQDLLDVYPRKVYYFPATGQVLIRKLRTLHNETLYAREKEYAARLKKSKVSGDVELF